MDITRIIPTGFNWSEPWESLSADEAARFEVELRAELSPGHVLEGIATLPIARRLGTDDIVLATSDAQHPIVIVHLTWNCKPESDPKFPWTVRYSNLAEALAGFEEP